MLQAANTKILAETMMGRHFSVLSSFMQSFGAGWLNLFGCFVLLFFIWAKIQK